VGEWGSGGVVILNQKSAIENHQSSIKTKN
jgi:hypothetical protein